LQEIVAYAEPENKWLQVRFDKVELPGGKIGRHNIVVEFPGRSHMSGVCVLPITAAGHIIMLRQFRYTVGSWSWEIPRGGPEANTTPKQQALAELEEETGYTTDPETGVFAMGGECNGDPTTFWPNNGISSTRVVFFAAVDVRPSATGSRPEHTEVIKTVAAFPSEEVFDMLRDGEIRDQFTICAVSLGLAHGLLTAPPPH
jgi:8-oxo-dGTP pyrophosphatase MutT (NUDIX family)